MLASLAVAGCSSTGSSAGPVRTVAASPTGVDATTPGATDYDAMYAVAVSKYRTYVNEQAAGLAQAAQGLRDAIARGDLQGARTAYAKARPYYLRIQAPAKYVDVSNQIDPQFLYIPIDSGVGMHRIEDGLWTKGSTDGLLPVAEQLVKDTGTLRDALATLPMDALRMTDTYAILDAHPIITNYEPEPYSHLGLLDHASDVEGSRFVFDQLRPAIAAASSELADEIAAAFDGADAALQPFRTPDGFALDSTLNDAQKQMLNQAFHDLSSNLDLVESVLIGTSKQTSGCFGGNALKSCQHGS
ncbi:MAG TPA: EfeM/EfeO family lipoprotein [Dehalococcoidia bacterium]|nr:EfeM/EfeO family lipoprotein [Dehalococcoidia bacterium]